MASKKNDSKKNGSRKSSESKNKRPKPSDLGSGAASKAANALVERQRKLKEISNW